ncbi:MAG TPA: hypothetical protein VLC09_10035 [Polyangiaceae bacterium]|nr:hypothetical protein [Polyangiaceae bacterium]
MRPATAAPLGARPSHALARFALPSPTQLGLTQLGLTLLGLTLLGACAAPTKFERRDGSLVYNARPVPPQAYSAYLRGLRAERQGNAAAAERAYTEATRADPAGGAAWAALGRLACPESPERAERWFDEGLEAAAEPAPIHVARSNCHRSRGHWAEAVADAQSAVELAPLDPAAAEALADAFEGQGDANRARSVRLASKQLAAARGRATSAPTRPEDSTGDWTSVDRALARGELRAARRAAPDGCTPGLLALRALALGQAQLAAEQAQWVLRADPEQIDALLTIWLLARSDEPHGTTPQPARELPLQPAFDEGTPSPLGLLLFARYLQRQVGDSASALFLQQWGPLPPLDAVESAVADGLTLAKPSATRLTL